MSGLYSMPIERAPNFFAAAMTVRPSPEPRSTTKSFGVVCAMRSIRSTRSSGVGTQMTSLPAWPTWGWKSFFSAWPWAAVASAAAARNATANRPAAGNFAVLNLCSFGVRGAGGGAAGALAMRAPNLIKPG